jgi:L-lactate dehydrogenase (cytochrome)/(S)-mandelate dehydrogenase
MMAGPIESAVNVNDVRNAAKRVLPAFLFDFIEGGVDDETGLFRNEDAFARCQLLPRYLNDISLRTETDLVMADIGCTKIPALVRNT